MPHRERYVFVCINRREDGHPKGSCAARGSEGIAKALKAELGRVGGALEARVCTTSCLDLCEIGVAMVYEPAHAAYGNVTMEDVPEIARAVADGKIVERLVRHPAPKGE